MSPCEPRKEVSHLCTHASAMQRYCAAVCACPPSLEPCELPSQTSKQTLLGITRCHSAPACLLGCRRRDVHHHPCLVQCGTQGRPTPLKLPKCRCQGVRPGSQIQRLRNTLRVHWVAHGANRRLQGQARHKQADITSANHTGADTAENRYSIVHAACCASTHPVGVHPGCCKVMPVRKSVLRNSSTSTALVLILCVCNVYLNTIHHRTVSTICNNGGGREGVCHDLLLPYESRRCRQ